MVSALRRNLLRVVYLMIFVFVTTQFWPDIVLRTRSWPLMGGVARCFLAALGPLTLLGLRYPVGMLPVLLFELAWKAIWLFGIGLPLYLGPKALDPGTWETVKSCAFGVVLCTAVIPWRHVFRVYLKAPAERWR